MLGQIVISMTVAWLLVADSLVWVFQEFSSATVLDFTQKSVRD